MAQLIRRQTSLGPRIPHNLRLRRCLVPRLWTGNLRKPQTRLDRNQRTLPRLVQPEKELEAHVHV
ncbi:hypothetical protein EMPG_14757 [Blastomyces silverae]|uniref:Uncharacterized protein n=1 Tax=Blastomyces silverae TaxID=2060906 RepID=A0A0H1BKZ2_9EURO|nr:hypothetical protein EMPG_14757 [Blastomyces silverae]